MNMNTPVVQIKMQNGGLIEVELSPRVAPNTVNNFLSLVKKGYYDGLIFHRVIAGFMIQGGCPDGTGMGGPGYGIKGEFSSNGVTNQMKHDRGVLSMARSMQPDSAGSQFFIMHQNSPHLDGSYAAFGRVTKGIEVVDEIAATKKGMQDRPKTPQVIESMTVVTDFDEYQEPETL
jgi:peptidyl-prolyl cis-trans isomerase B (cyclophilin B)